MMRSRRDHADLGIKVLKELPFMQKLAAEDAELVLFAIQNHNKKLIAPTGNKRCLFLRVFKGCRQAGYLSRAVTRFIAPSDGTGFSPDFLEQFVAGEQCDYTRIRTQDDRKLVRLMWVYDVNFSWTLQRIAERGYNKGNASSAVCGQ